MMRKRTSLNNRHGFTLLELLTVVAIISILVTISVPIYRNVQKDAEKTVMEYNTKVISCVLRQYLDEQREEGNLSRSTVRGLLSAPIGDPENPLYGRIDGTNLKETWFTYVNVSYNSDGYGGFGIEWKHYTAEYSPGEGITVKDTSQSE